jgi:hypothetical protein
MEAGHRRIADIPGPQSEGPGAPSSWIEKTMETGATRHKLPATTVTSYFSGVNMIPSSRRAFSAAFLNCTQYSFAPIGQE